MDNSPSSAEQLVPQTLHEMIAHLRASPDGEAWNACLYQLQAWMGHVGPVMTANYYCEQFRIWERAFLAESDHLAEAFSIVRLAINKSCLLDRLIYGGEKLRTEKCPVHEGVWSGCVPDPCEFCSFGINVTGWVRHDLSPETRARLEVIRKQSSPEGS